MANLNNYLREVILPRYIADILNVDPTPFPTPTPNPTPGPGTSFERSLASYVGRNVTIETTSGETIQGVLRTVNGSFVTVQEPETLSPFTPASTTFIRTDEIVSFTVDN